MCVTHVLGLACFPLLYIHCYFCEWIKLSYLSHMHPLSSLSLCLSVCVCLCLSDIFFISFSLERHLADSTAFCCEQTAIDKHNQVSFWYPALKYLKHVSSGSSIVPCGSSASNALINLSDNFSTSLNSLHSHLQYTMVSRSLWPWEHFLTLSS